MKRLTDEQKMEIRTLRGSGLGYKSIAKNLCLSRETVRSFCVRNDVASSGRDKTGQDEQIGTGNDIQIKAGEVEKGEGGASELKLGKTIFIIRTDYSETASETLEKKLEKLILDDVSRQYRNCQFLMA